MRFLDLRIFCTECFLDYGHRWKRARFVVNGQSVCSKHVRSPIRDRGQPAMAYTYSAPDGEPVLEPVHVGAETVPVVGQVQRRRCLPFTHQWGDPYDPGERFSAVVTNTTVWTCAKCGATKNSYWA